MFFQVETYNTKTGEVVHGFTISAYDEESARMQYMREPERPRLTADLDVRVSR